MRTRARTYHGTLQQGRVGGVARLALHPRLIGVVGYYFGREADGEWHNFHRLFTGVDIPLPAGFKVRSMVEREMPTGEPDYFLFRERLRWAGEWRVAPFAGAEWFLDADGHRSVRYNTGLIWRAANWAALEIGYLYDARVPRAGAPRHAFVTQWVIHRAR